MKNNNDSKQKTKKKKKKKKKEKLTWITKKEVFSEKDVNKRGKRHINLFYATGISVPPESIRKPMKSSDMSSEFYWGHHFLLKMCNFC